MWFWVPCCAQFKLEPRQGAEGALVWGPDASIQVNKPLFITLLVSCPFGLHTICERVHCCLRLAAVLPDEQCHTEPRA